MNDEPKMNYCCDCGWAVKKGLFRKTWYCTCPQKNEVFGSHVFHPVTCKPMIKTPIACDVARFVGKEGATEQHAVNLKHPCPYYKGELRHHPAIPPMKCPLPCPPLPERVEKATQEHDAAYLMNQKQNDIEAENNRLRGLIAEIREFLIEGAVPGRFHLKQECIREIYTIANEEAGHCDSACPNDEMAKLEGEKHKLKVAVQFLVNEMKSFCNCFGLNGNCARFDCRGCYQTCEIYKDIKRYDCLEDDK